MSLRERDLFFGLRFLTEALHHGVPADDVKRAAAMSTDAVYDTEEVNPIIIIVTTR